jgi:hypothetical protein
LKNRFNQHLFRPRAPQARPKTLKNTHQTPPNEAKKIVIFTLKFPATLSFSEHAP